MSAPATPDAATPVPALLSGSCGKDSALALYHARANGLEVRWQVTMLEETGERSRSHGIPRALVQVQAAAQGLELLMPAADWAGYEAAFTGALGEIAARGAKAAVFGDIDLASHREWEERVCAAAGLRAELPLWGRGRTALAREILAHGYKAVVVCTDSRHLPDEFCGRQYDAEFLAQLPAGVDLCGENGEFHTFVYDGPGFSAPVPYRLASFADYTAPPQYGSVRYRFAQLATA